MRIISFNKTKQKQRSITIGNFDGIHLGHQSLIRATINIAQQQHLTSSVVLFEPQPLEFFLKQSAPARLSSISEKISFLKTLSLDEVIILRFNNATARHSAQQFVEKVLHDQLRTKHIVAGNDFRFGYNREGDIKKLQLFSKPLSIDVSVLPDEFHDDVRISSTEIRKALLDNHFDLAGQLLGRPYTMSGRVTYGQQRGRLIGIPTANIPIRRIQSPLRGVYAAYTHGAAEKPIPSIVNIGSRPTVDGKLWRIETHLFDFNENLYGKRLSVQPLHRIRDEQKFDSWELLKAQILKDVKDTRTYFNL